MARIDANTKLNSQEYKMAENRDAITDGLSEEAIGYVNQAVGRAEENKYSIYDRTATYQNFEGIGWQKIQETFDADGNGTNEVDINKNIEVKSDSYWDGGVQGSTGDKSFWDKAKDWWNGLWGKDTKEEYSPSVKVDSHYISSEVNVGVNPDNIGAHHEEDRKIVHHYEYYESNVKNPKADAYYDYSNQGKDRARMSGEDYLSETHIREE